MCLLPFEVYGSSQNRRKPPCDWKKTGKISIFRETVNKIGTIQGRACQAGVWGVAQGVWAARAPVSFGGLCGARGLRSVWKGGSGCKKRRRSRGDQQEATRVPGAHEGARKVVAALQAGKALSPDRISRWSIRVGL